jgi:outer membrane protein, heavy metal efflux system
LANYFRPGPPGARTRTALAAVLWLGIYGGCAAEEVGGHSHDPVAEDPALTLPAAVDKALEAYPGAGVLTARAAEAAAWADRGGSWLASRPSLMLRYQTDRFGSDDGLTEYEVGIDLPLWAVGGRSAVRDYAAALGGESESSAAGLRWEVAGQVRIALWQIALAENDHELAEQALATAEKLAVIVARRFELGDVAEADVLLARTAVLERRNALVASEAALLDAERNWRILTGLDRRPGFAAEALSERTSIVNDHPALALAAAAVARAEAELRVAEKAGSAGPSLLVGTRREQPAFGTELDNSIGVTMLVPFGGSAHLNTAITAAARTAAAVRAERDRQARELQLALHEAAHGLNVMHANLANAEEHLELATRQQAMAELAYEKGEMDLIDLLNLQSAAVAARREVSRNMLDEKRQIAYYNQAVGKLP